jgi:hypothetical protein
MTGCIRNQLQLALSPTRSRCIKPMLPVKPGNFGWRLLSPPARRMPEIRRFDRKLTTDD